MSLVNRCVCGADMKKHHRHVCWPSDVVRVTPAKLRKMFLFDGKPILNLTGHHPCAEGPCGCDLGFRIFALKRDAARWAKARGWRLDDVTPARNRWSDCFVVGQQITSDTFRVLGDNGPVDLAFLPPNSDREPLTDSTGCDI